MSPRPVRRVSSREVRSLLRKADKLMSESNELGEEARRALHRAFRAQEELDRPTADDRERRARIAKGAGKR